MAICESSSDTMAEWLRRGTANPLGSARASSNLVSIAFCQNSADSMAAIGSCGKVIILYTSMRCDVTLFAAKRKDDIEG